MPISITADKPEEFPEPLRQVAKEDGGKFVLPTIPDGWGLDNVAQSRAKLTKLEQDSKRAAERMKAFAKNEKGDIYEAEEFASLLAEHKALKEAQGKQPNIEELRKQINQEAEGRYTKKLTEAERRAAELDRELDGTVLSATINDLVAQMRPKADKADLVRLLLREQLGLDKEDGKRQVRVKDATPGGNGWMLGGNTQDGYMAPKDFALGNLRTKYADLFEGDGASGAGAQSTNSSGRRSKYTFPASKLQTSANEYYAMQKRANAEGLSVEILQNA